jgi:hypothetical protein
MRHSLCSSPITQAFFQITYRFWVTIIAPETGIGSAYFNNFKNLGYFIKCFEVFKNSDLLKLNCVLVIGLPSERSRWDYGMVSSIICWFGLIYWKDWP